MPIALDYCDALTLVGVLKGFGLSTAHQDMCALLKIQGTVNRTNTSTKPQTAGGVSRVELDRAKVKRSTVDGLQIFRTSHASFALSSRMQTYSGVLYNCKNGPPQQALSPYLARHVALLDVRQGPLDSAIRQKDTNF